MLQDLTCRVLSKHQTFGLRAEWVDLYLRDSVNSTQNEDLGPRQLQSLSRWLKTAGFLNIRGVKTELFSITNLSGVKSSLPWEYIWTNTVFNFFTATWYATKCCFGEWSTTEIAAALGARCPSISSRSIRNGIMELVGLLERTPVGRELGQGEVSAGRPRRVRRTGRVPSVQAVRHALLRLCLTVDATVLPLDAAALWPWTIFGCDQAAVIEPLVLGADPWFTVESNHLTCSLALEEIPACLYTPITSR